GPPRRPRPDRAAESVRAGRRHLAARLPARPAGPPHRPSRRSPGQISPEHLYRAWSATGGGWAGRPRPSLRSLWPLPYGQQCAVRARTGIGARLDVADLETGRFHGLPQHSDRPPIGGGDRMVEGLGPSTGEEPHCEPASGPHGTGAFGERDLDAVRRKVDERTPGQDTDERRGLDSERFGVGDPIAGAGESDPPTWRRRVAPNDPRSPDDVFTAQGKGPDAHLGGCRGPGSRPVPVRPGAFRSALLLDLGVLTVALAQVVQLGATHVTAAQDVDLVHGRAVPPEGARDADAEGDLAHGEGLTDAAALATDDYAPADLHTVLPALDALDVHADGVAASER